MIYSKQGATVRLEHIRGARTLLTLAERGTAEEQGRAFRCASSSDGEAPEVDEGAVLAIEAAIEAAAAPVERLTIVAGVAHHRFGDITWSESHVRLSASLVHAERRVTVDLGGDRWTPELTAIVTSISDALRRSDGRIAKGPTLLAPHLAAHLWPEILLATLERSIRAPLQLSQSTHPEFAADGFGRVIEPLLVFDGSAATPPERWPNYYRPSYRSRPARAAFHIRAAIPRYDGDWRHEAIALLAPFTVRGEHITARVLCSDGAIAEIDAPLSALRSVDGTELWIPVSAGSWGRPVVALSRS